MRAGVLDAPKIWYLALPLMCVYKQAFDGALRRRGRAASIRLRLIKSRSGQQRSTHLCTLIAVCQLADSCSNPLWLQWVCHSYIDVKKWVGALEPVGVSFQQCATGNDPERIPLRPLDPLATRSQHSLHKTPLISGVRRFG
eukprot:2711604-Amphidinium_carterae.1